MNSAVQLTTSSMTSIIKNLENENILEIFLQVNKSVCGQYTNKSYRKAHYYNILK